MVASQRIYSWYRHFHKFGLYPVIVTRHWNHEIDTLPDLSRPDNSPLRIEKNDWGEVHYLPYRGTLRDRFMTRYGSRYALFRRVLSLAELFAPYIHPALNPFRSFRQYADAYIADHKPSFLLVSGNPYTLFQVGHYLQKKHGIPWFADYRDDWTQNHLRRITSLPQKGLLSIEKRAEKKYMKNVSAILTVSGVLVKQIAARLKKDNVYLIENGAELDFYHSDLKDPYPADSFVICYTGIMYDFGYMDIFSEGFREFISGLEKEEAAGVRVYFIGTETNAGRALDKMTELAAAYPQNVVTLKKLPAREIAPYQAFADVLLNLIVGDPADGIIGAKTYTYGVTGRPILAVTHVPGKNSPFFPGRDIQYIANTPDEVSAFLRDVYQRKMQGQDTRTSITDEEKYMLSREYNARKLAEIILENEKGPQ